MSVCLRLYPMLNHFLRLQGKVLEESGVQRSGCRSKFPCKKEDKIDAKAKPVKEFVTVCFTVLVEFRSDISQLRFTTDNGLSDEFFYYESLQCF